MSGFEVVGLVLATIPLIVTAIKNYNDGVRSMKKMKNISRELNTLSITLVAQHSILLNSLESMLGEDVDSLTMSMLLNDIGGQLWREASIDDFLRSRLQRDYRLFFAAVELVNTAVLDLQRRLNVNLKGKTFLQRTISNLKAGLSLHDYKQELESISTNNSTIAKLAHQTNILLPARKSREKIPDSEASRAQAASIFSSLQAGLSQRCGHNHVASLALDKPSPRIELQRGRLNKNAGRQNLLLHHSPPPKSPEQPSWEGESVDICLLFETGNKTDKVPTFRQTTRRQVSKTAPAVQYQQRIDKIPDLCQSLGQTTKRTGGVCFGYLSDESNHLSCCHYGLYWPQDGTKAMATKPKKLEAMIGNNSRGSEMKDEFKRRLALHLARGMLHLFNTPWLREQWGSKDILLSSPSPATETNQAQDLLFLSTNVEGNLSKRKYFQNCSLIRNETVFALGIMLIEICMEQTFDEISGRYGSADVQSKDMHDKSPFRDYLAADKLLEDVYIKLGHRYGNAVRRCIRCEFDQRKTVLEDSAFRKAVYDGVVVELQRDVDNLK